MEDKMEEAQNLKVKHYSLEGRWEEMTKEYDKVTH